MLTSLLPDCDVNQQAQAMAARKGIALPQEFLAAAAQGGLRQSVLLQYALLQVGTGITTSSGAACSVALSSKQPP